MMLFIQDGITYYNYLLRSVKGSDEDSSHCSYQFLLHLGDLSRYLYIEENGNTAENPSQQTNSYSQAESFYLEAIRQDPNKGNAYHQLSVLTSYYLLLLFIVDITKTIV